MGKKKVQKSKDYKYLKDRGRKLEALIRLSNNIRDRERRMPISFNDFLYTAAEKPELIFRSIFQLFHDMVCHYVGDGVDEYAKSKHSIGFLNYDTSALFVKDQDNPFFADRLFSNRFMDMVRSFRKGVMSNHLYLFEGPPGSGKSTFLNNLLFKLEEYARQPEGVMFQTHWKLDVEKLGGESYLEEKLNKLMGDDIDEDMKSVLMATPYQRRFPNRYLELDCPNHDHPILQIPKSYREEFLDELIPNKEFKKRLFNDKEYEWALTDNPCSICNSIYKTTLDITGDPLAVFNMINARQTQFSRQFGVGVSVFNPGDERMIKPIHNKQMQEKINELLQTDKVRYVYSDLANTNNGVYALMDIKENNIERLKGLHGIISDGVHKVELVEERIKSLFMGLVNPEDKVHYANVKSFQDRIISVNIPYILDYRTEQEIYKDKFGESTEQSFMPHVFAHFARLVVSTRLDTSTPAIKHWISKPEKYELTDNKLRLLKMEIYSGNIPDWLSDEDIKSFDKHMRRRVIDESEVEGKSGYSGRQSISVFNDFFEKHQKKDKQISFRQLIEYFSHKKGREGQVIDSELLQALEKNYDYTVLQEVRDSLYYYNKEEIERDIYNYLYAINYEIGDTVRNPRTKDKIDVDEEFYKSIEPFFSEGERSLKERQAFRGDVQDEYVRKALAQEINVEGKSLEETGLFKDLYARYTRKLKQNALAPFDQNENFRRAIYDYGTKDFNTYDSRLRRDIEYMIGNLMEKYNYTENGARDLALYVIEKQVDGK